MPAQADPELTARLAREVQRLYAEADLEMQTAIARQLGLGIDDLGWAELKAAEVARVRKALTETIDGLEDKAPAAITEALTKAYAAGAAAEATVKGEFGRNSGRALQSLVKETLNVLNAPNSPILRLALDDYRSIIAETTTRVNMGTMTRRQASQAALDRFASKGIKGFVDSAGRKWEIESYAEMAVRTASGRAQIAGTLDRMQLRGIDFVIVSNAPEECKACRLWEGKILSVSGNGVGKQEGFRVVGSVDDARRAGLFHANCRHNLSAYVHGLTDPPTHTVDREGDEERQQQRKLERRVRRVERRVAVRKAFLKGSKEVTPDDRMRLRMLLDQRDKTIAELDDFIDQTGRKRLSYREQITEAR